MASLQVVQPKRRRDGIKYLVGHVGGPALFEPGIVVRADTRQHRQLLAAQTGHPPAIACGCEADVRRGQPSAARLQKLRQLVLAGGHAVIIPAAQSHGAEPGSDRPRSNVTCHTDMKRAGGRVDAESKR